MSGSLMISLKGCTSMMFGACCFSRMASARSMVALGTAGLVGRLLRAGPVLTRPMSVSLEGADAGGAAGVCATAEPAMTVSPAATATAEMPKRGKNDRGWGISTLRMQALDSTA